MPSTVVLQWVCLKPEHVHYYCSRLKAFASELTVTCHLGLWPSGFGFIARFHELFHARRATIYIPHTVPGTVGIRHLFRDRELEFFLVTAMLGHASHILVLNNDVSANNGTSRPSSFVRSFVRTRPAAQHWGI